MNHESPSYLVLVVDKGIVLWPTSQRYTLHNNILISLADSNYRHPDVELTEEFFAWVLRDAKFPAEVCYFRVRKPPAALTRF